MAAHSARFFNDLDFFAPEIANFRSPSGASLGSEGSRGVSRGGRVWIVSRKGSDFQGNFRNPVFLRGVRFPMEFLETCGKAKSMDTDLHSLAPASTTANLPIMSVLSPSSRCRPLLDARARATRRRDGDGRRRRDGARARGALARCSRALRVERAALRAPALRAAERAVSARVSQPASQPASLHTASQPGCSQPVCTQPTQLRALERRGPRLSARPRGMYAV